MRNLRFRRRQIASWQSNISHQSCSSSSSIWWAGNVAPKTFLQLHHLNQTESRCSLHDHKQFFLTFTYHWAVSSKKVPLNWYHRSYSQRGDERREECRKAEAETSKQEGKKSGCKRLQWEVAQRAKTGIKFTNKKRAMNDRKKINARGMKVPCAQDVHQFFYFMFSRFKGKMIEGKKKLLISLRAFKSIFTALRKIKTEIGEFNAFEVKRKPTKHLKVQADGIRRNP